MKLAIILLLAAALTGCTQMKDYYPDSTMVHVNGVDVSVNKMPRGQNTWHATPNNPKLGSLFLRDPTISINNVAAIEKLTGCKVVPASVENQEMHTFAAVKCGD